MVHRESDSKVRKLALPLTFNLGQDGIASDGFFKLDSALVSKVVIKSIDADGYAICELYQPSKKERTIRLKVSNAMDTPTLIGTEFSKSSNRGYGRGEYKYFELPDGNIYAEISGKRKRRIQLGSLKDRTSRISMVKQMIAQHFPIGKEFDKKQLIKFLPKRLTYGQTLKSTLDVLKIKGYLDMRETKYMGRPHELFIPTNKIHKMASLNMSKWASSEQA